MKVTLNWIKEFLNTGKLDALDAVKMAEMLTMSGTEVEKVEPVGSRFDKIVIGRIKSFTGHPDADKLSLCRVDSGSGELSIVCGASNFKEGDRVALALEGARIGTFKIKRSKIRGEYSEGMMCSEAELGLSSESEGIMILDSDCPIGADFAGAVGLDDVVFDLEITPNRPDCLSIIGIAREISAVTGHKLIIPGFDIDRKTGTDRDLIIEIEDTGLCPRYSAMVFEDIPVKDSPMWLKNRLTLCGIRPIGLIVDITNYIMLETGQPLHAFDRDLLSSNKIIVRKARKGEEIRTIDDSVRKLEKDALLIADEEKAIALAGIMGGKDTEINSNTKNILLESANFYGPSIMNTSQKLGLRSEASNRFEKKIDPELTVFALERFNQLLTKITGYINKNGIYDSYSRTNRQRDLVLRTEKVEKVLGQSVDAGKISDILSSLGIENKIKGDALEAKVPSFRFEDLEREIDLIEEVARIYGYNNIISKPTILSKNRGRYSKGQSNIKNIRNMLADCGLNEVINYSFIGLDEFRETMLDEEEDYKKYIEILNPINEDFRIMRTSLLPSLLGTVKNNMNRNAKDIAIFEISKVFMDEGKELPGEPQKLGILLSGKAEQKSWLEEERDFDFFDLKGIVENIAGRFYPRPEVKIAEKEYRFFHPGISGDLLINNIKTGILGRVHPLIIENMEIGQDTYYGEIDLDVFNENITGLKTYKKISAFPAIDIDLAIVIDENIKNDDILNEIKKSGSSILRSIRLFDIYRGEQVEQGKKSMAYSLSFREDDRTLKDTEVEIIVNRIIENLEKKFNAGLRT